MGWWANVQRWDERSLRRSVGQSGGLIGCGRCRFQGCAEPAGERFSQRERGGVGGFVDGGGPRDVGVRADQERVGWSAIGFGSVDVDAMLPRALHDDGSVMTHVSWIDR